MNVNPSKIMAFIFHIFGGTFFKNHFKNSIHLIRQHQKIQIKTSNPIWKKKTIWVVLYEIESHSYSLASHPRRFIHSLRNIAVLHLYPSLSMVVCLIIVSIRQAMNLKIDCPIRVPAAPCHLSNQISIQSEVNPKPVSIVMIRNHQGTDQIKTFLIE